MKRAAFIVAFLIVSSALVTAGTITLNFGAPIVITTTAAQDAAIARLLVRVNAERAAQKLSAWTPEQWLQSILVSAIQSYVQQAKEHEASDGCVAYQQLSAPDKASIRTTLGGNAPCL